MSCCICYARVYLYQECVSPFFSLTSSNFWPVAFLSLQCQSMAGPERALLMISKAAGPEITFTPPSFTLHFSYPLSSSLPSTFSSVFSSHTSLFISLYILPHLSFLFPHSSHLSCLLSLHPLPPPGSILLSLPSPASLPPFLTHIQIHLRVQWPRWDTQSTWSAATPLSCLIGAKWNFLWELLWEELH